MSSAEHSHLDQIRISKGDDECKQTLNTLLWKDTRRAVKLLNDSKLRFPTLFILHEPIMQQKVHRFLNTRNFSALQMISQIKNAATITPNAPLKPLNTSPTVLKWMLETGAAEETPHDDYAQILDVAAAKLLTQHKDSTALPLVVDLMFQRNRNGGHIHDLVWAVFHLHNPMVLTLVAQQLSSENPKDSEFAAELLHIDHMKPVTDANERQQKAFLQQLEENLPYLYFTEESFQYSSNPTFCAVDLERKYLQKAASSHEKQPLASADEDEQKCLATFRHLSAEEQQALSAYSHSISTQNADAWKQWLHAPVEKQLEAAKMGRRDFV